MVACADRAWGVPAEYLSVCCQGAMVSMVYRLRRVCQVVPAIVLVFAGLLPRLGKGYGGGSW